MPHYAGLREYDLDLGADDIRGAILQDRSGDELGTVKDAVVEHESGDVRYLIADIGGREVLIPADRVLRSQNDETIQVNLSLPEARRLPAANETDVLKQTKTENRSAQQARNQRPEAQPDYDPDETEGTVIHREGSDHLVTPEPGEMPVVRDNEDIDSSRLTPHRMADKFGGVGQPITNPTGIPRGSGGSSDWSNSGNFEFRGEQNEFPELESRGRRWDRFAHSLRDRHLATMRRSCNVCAGTQAA